MAAKFELYKDKAGEFRWRLRHTNGNIIADSGEGYKTKANAINGINSVKENAPQAAVKELPPKAAPKPKAAPAAAVMPKTVKYSAGMGIDEGGDGNVLLTIAAIAAASFFVIGGGIALIAMGSF